MADVFERLFGANADRREPTNSEWDQGFPCGEADRKLFNWLFWSLQGAVNDVGIYKGDYDITIAGWQKDPPTTPLENRFYVVAQNPTGAWIGHANDVATFRNGEWIFIDPMIGLQANFVQNSRFAVIWFDGTDWNQITGTIEAGANTTFTVNANGSAQFINLTDCFKFLRGFTIPADATVTVQVQSDLVEPNSVDLYHADGARIAIYGPAMRGAFPIFTDFTGTRSTDENMLRSRWGATITCVSSVNVLNIIGSRIKEIRDLCIIGKRTGGTATEGTGLNPGTCISVGETDISRFNRVGTGGVYLNRVALSGADIDLFLRQTSDVTYSDLVTVYGNFHGIRIANNSYGGAFTGRLFALYSGRAGVNVRDGSTFETNPDNAEMRNNQIGIECINQSHAQCVGAKIQDNTNYNIFASVNSSVIALNASINGAGVVGVRAEDRAYVDATGTPSNVTASPTFNTSGNYDAYIKKIGATAP